ncbi:MAG: ATP phosphoribosyltransferase [Fervidobacterium sp.]|nr:ATP phosphoribosyltransferase [Fervidobacterium sp.]
MLRIALAKGRLENESIAYLEKCGYKFEEKLERKLVLRDCDERIELLSVKPLDVPIYVHWGIADVGICGTDSIVESQLALIQPMKLPFGLCSMVLASFQGFRFNGRRVKIASKFPVSAKKYLESRNVDAELIKLNGSVELAPVVGLADAIIDIVQTGKTLREHGLVIIEQIYRISAMVCVNDVAYRTKRIDLQALFDRLWNGLNNQVS